MIRDETTGGFVPGTLPPTHLLDGRNVDIQKDFQPYLDKRLWEAGTGVNLLGPAGSGKTTQGLTILRNIWDLDPMRQSYWTEQDFLSDLRNLWRLEEMTQKTVRDDVLWAEYVEWERTFWAIKEAPYLFLDDIGHAYTPMQWYEVENLVRSRYNKNLPTMYATTDLLVKTMPETMRSLVFRNVVTLTLEPR